MSYPLCPSKDRLDKIVDILRFLEDGKEAASGIIYRWINILRDNKYKLESLISAKQVCLSAGLIEKRHVKYTVNTVRYSLTPKGIRFLEMLQKERDSVLAWEYVVVKYG